MADHKELDPAEGAYLRQPPECSLEEMEETLAFLASIIPADAPAVHRERLEAIRERVYRARHMLWCGGPAAPQRGAGVVSTEALRELWPASPPSP